MSDALWQLPLSKAAVVFSVHYFIVEAEPSLLAFLLGFLSHQSIDGFGFGRHAGSGDPARASAGWESRSCLMPPWGPGAVLDVGSACRRDQGPLLMPPTNSPASMPIGVLHGSSSV